MVKSESSKRVKASKGGIDRISNLPEPLLSHILSLLPTKCAVATSVLSTKWKLLWPSVSNLDFCSPKSPSNYYSTAYPEEEKKFNMKNKKFTHFVNKVLILLNPPSIQNFRLKCYQDGFDPSYLNSWISAGFGRTVREFELSFTSNESLQLPLSLIYCSLAVLKLDGDINFNILAATSVCFPSLQAIHLHGITFEIANNSSVSFPNLKIMHLMNVMFENEYSVHKLLSSSPVLDDLVIKREDPDNIKCLIIRIPSLTRLSIYFPDIDDVFILQIDTPALQYLNLYYFFPCEYLPSENLSSLIQAKVKILLRGGHKVNVESCVNIIKVIESLSNAKFLSLSWDIMKAFRIASANISLSFHNLTRLELKVYNCLELYLVINKFLESMKNLEHLVMKGWSSYDCSGRSQWNEPLNVPKCLLSRVTTVSFIDFFFDCCAQLEILRYFLKNAEVLQLLTIGTNFISSEKEQLELLKRFH